MADDTARDQGLVANLTKLEINTIIKENLTARKMPDPGNAILDIALTYAWELEASGFDIDAWFTDPHVIAAEAKTRGKQRLEDLRNLEANLAEKARLEMPSMQQANLAKHSPGFDDDLITIDAKTFITLRWAAWLMSQNPKVSGKQQVILSRIRQNSDQMKNLLLRLYGEEHFEPIFGCSRTSLNRIGDDPRAQARDNLQVATRDMTLLRKTWEIGVQEVVAQTVIDLDGDTITYISRRYSSPSWGHMLEVHRLGVQSAVGYWGNLMEAMRRFLTDLVSIAAGGSSRNKGS